jgi:hypothetical protein
LFPARDIRSCSPGINPVVRCNSLVGRWWKPPTIDRKVDGRGSDTVVSKLPEQNPENPALEETP